MKKRKIKIGIIGHGFVGKATANGFKKDVEKAIIDPKNKTKVSDLKDFNPDICFICVPTPMSKEGSIDSSIVESVVKEIKQNCPKTLTVIKSTVIPKVLTELEKINKNIIYNPEFLREKHADYDFKNSPMLIFGGMKNKAKLVSEIFKKHSKCKTKKHIFLDLKSASLVKYAINNYLATKVVFFNELWTTFNTMELKDNWKKITDTIALDSRVGNSHMDVPGHDGKLGFGGACFPKDIAAFISFSNDIGSNSELLKSAGRINNKIRKQYEELDEREKEQNVTYNDNIFN